MISTSTAVGNWSFILKVTDSTGAEVNSSTTSVTVNSNRITVKLPAADKVSISGSPSNGPISTAPPDSWTSKAPMPVSGYFDAAAVVNGTIYVMGSSSNYAYNPVSDTWVSNAPMPTPRTSFAEVAWNERIYVIGGKVNFGEYASAVVEVYDPLANTWVTASAMPTALSQIKASTVNGKIYVIGGRTASAYSTVNLTEIYDPFMDSWNTGAPMPYPVASYSSAVVDNQIYVIGGQDEWYGFTGFVPMGTPASPPPDPNVKFNQVYNPATNTWRLGASIPETCTSAGAAATAGDMVPKRIYVFGGSLGFGVGSNRTYAYDPATNTWTIAASMPDARYSPAVAVVNDLFYVLGGGNERTVLSNNWQYTPIGYSSAPSLTSVTMQAKTNNGSTVNLAISGNITISQISNVTISTNQSAFTTSISFTLTGQSGTTGFGNVTIPKNTVPYGTSPKIYSDGQQAQNQGFTQDSNNYYVWYSTHFSTHQISIVFTQPPSSPGNTAMPNQLEIIYGLIAGLTIVALVIAALILIIKSGKHRKTEGGDREIR